MSVIEIEPLRHCDAVITLPGSKSYTHRALIIAALADGESILSNGLRCEDTEYTIRGLTEFHVPIFWKEGFLHVLGTGGKLQGTGKKLFVGGSGTSMRFLTALASIVRGTTVLYGSERMEKRPMGELIKGLESLGVKAYSQEVNGYPPVIVESDRLSGGEARIRGNESSQFVSALLMAAPYAKQDVLINVVGPLFSRAYVDMTVKVMSDFGVSVKREGDRSFGVKAGQRYSSRTYSIEGDASHASYFLAAAAITRGRIRVGPLSSTSVQGDTGFLHILRSMGCEVVRGEGWVEVQGRDLKGLEVDMNAMPDLVPTLAVTAAFAEGRTVIRNIRHLRFKESDRIHTLTCELTKLGIHVEEGENWMSIEGGTPHGAEIVTYNDHRLVMSFAVAGLAISGIKIDGERCVDKSFPGFWETLTGLYT